MQIKETLEAPVFVLTSDQDWAPTWAARHLLERLSDFPLHVFRTNPCEAFDKALSVGQITQGWHPNFLPNSTHGQRPEDVIAYMKSHFPGATTARSHAFYEDSHAWQLLAEAGIAADSQMLTRYEAGIRPLRHWTGITRFPVYFEDDVFLIHHAPELQISNIRDTLFTPGLKVLNLHATFIAYNIPSQDYYDSIKQDIFQDASKDCVWKERGIANVLDDLLQEIDRNGYSFVSFPELAEATSAYTEVSTWS